MAFIDELDIHAKAGNGGDGVVRWRREKFIELGGPAGGNGGNGGNICLRAKREMSLLNTYANKKVFEAENGADGRKQNEYGRNGDDLYIELPVGSIVTNKNTGTVVELLNNNEELCILRGGRGGLGNLHFKSSTNRSPEEHTDGKPGEEADCHIEVRLVADIGLVGLPNAGKSTLLNAITNAQSKVAEYAFTTVEPHLGALPGGIIIADIPGLIEGASVGKGLGHKFLRHIRRTKVLAHLVSFENENMMEVYEQIRGELKNYDAELAEKKEIIVLSKSDLVDDTVAMKKKKEFEKLGREVLLLSAYDDASVKNFVKAINKYA